MVTAWPARVRYQAAERPAGPGADHGDALAGVAAGPEPGRALVAGRPVQGADGDGVVDLAAAALGLAVARADAAEDAGEGQVVGDDRRGAGQVALLDALEERRDVDVGRAGRRAGRLAVGVVVGEVHLEVAFALGPHARRLGAHDEAVVDPGRAGGLELGPALDLDEAQAAGAPGGHALDVAERRDVDAGPLGRRQDGLALGRGHERAVDGELQGVGRGGAHFDLPPTVASTPVSTVMASKLQTSRQVSHLMHSL